MRPRNPYEVRDADALKRRVETSTRVTRHTTRSLAEITGFSHATIGHLLTGRKRRVTLELASRLSEALGAPMDELFVPTVSSSADADKGGTEARSAHQAQAGAGRSADAPETQR